MTIADFLYQSGFWQWIGILVLVALVGQTLVGIASGLGKFRFQDRHDTSNATWNTTNHGERKP